MILRIKANMEGGECGSLYSFGKAEKSDRKICGLPFGFDGCSGLREEVNNVGRFFPPNPGLIEVETFYSNNKPCVQELRFSIPSEEWSEFEKSQLYLDLTAYVDKLGIQYMQTPRHDNEPAEEYGLTARCILNEYPEQYEVYDSERHMVGYIRVKDHYCEAWCPDADSNDMVYSSYVTGYMSFDKVERSAHLIKSLYAIKQWCISHPGEYGKKST